MVSSLLCSGILIRCNCNTLLRFTRLILSVTASVVESQSYTVYSDTVFATIKTIGHNDMYIGHGECLNTYAFEKNQLLLKLTLI